MTVDIERGPQAALILRQVLSPNDLKTLDINEERDFRFPVRINLPRPDAEALKSLLSMQGIRTKG